MKEIGARIRDIRTAAGMTQPEFADSIGITKGQLYKVEAGKSNLSRSAKIVIALRYGVDTSWIEAGTGRGPKKNAVVQNQALVAQPQQEPTIRVAIRCLSKQLFVDESTLLRVVMGLMGDSHEMDAATSRGASRDNDSASADKA